MPSRSRQDGDLLEVACASSEDYLPHCASMLHSIFVHEVGPVRVHFLHGDGMDAASVDRLSGMITRSGAEFVAHRIEKSRLRGVDRFAAAPSWYRVLLPELLPDLDRVLYLDSDMIITASLRPLWRVDISKHPVAAVSAVFPGPEWGARHCAALGIPDQRSYFVSGLMLMNLRWLRKEGHPAGTLDYALAHGDRNWFWKLPDEPDDTVRHTSSSTLSE